MLSFVLHGNLMSDIFAVAVGPDTGNDDYSGWPESTPPFSLRDALQYS